MRGGQTTLTDLHPPPVRVRIKHASKYDIKYLRAAQEIMSDAKYITFGALYF